MNFKLKVKNKPLTSLAYISNLNKLKLNSSKFDKTNYRDNKIFELSNLFFDSDKIVSLQNNTKLYQLRGCLR